MVVLGRKKLQKVRDFVKQCLDEGITSPAKMRDRYNQQYGLEGDKGKTRFAFTKAMRRMGVSAKKRLELKREAMKETEVKDIEDYPEVKRYLGFSDFQQIGERQKQKTLRQLRELWELMGCTDPNTWEFDPNVSEDLNLIANLKKHIGQNELGQWKRPHKVMALLGAYNRTFQGYLPKGWSMGLKRDAGELKDFLEFEEFNEFIANLIDTPQMSKEGWEALYDAEVNSGARGGGASTRTKALAGILSLLWENINYRTRRCSIRDKGKKGKPMRIWNEVPLDLFYWINGWEALMKWHEQRYGYRPTQERHAFGRCFPVGYYEYRSQFHRTRRTCKSRISQDLETMRTHIFRKTHAQWCKRIGVSLENLCGNPKDKIGRYGVGWDDPKVPLAYYLTPEPEEYLEQDQKIKQRLEKLQNRGILPQIPQTPLIS